MTGLFNDVKERFLKDGAGTIECQFKYAKNFNKILLLKSFYIL